MNSSHCYKLLGLDEGASINQIKDAYRKLALEYHPDKNMSAKDGEKFKIISEAYHTLREKNNSHVRIDHRTSYSTKNHQYRKNGFPAWLNLFYSEIYYTYTRYVKNIHFNYLKYEPIFLAHYNKIKRNIPIRIHRSIEFFRHNHIRTILVHVFNYLTTIFTNRNGK